MSDTKDPASFRDPSGYVFRRDGVLYRHVAPAYAEHYEALLGSGLHAELTRAGLLVPHVETQLAGHEDAFRVLQPEPLPVVSYPYEWCFSQLHDAAALTIEVARRALARGLVLKDASAFNVQFTGCRPVLVDTLSFERYVEGEPWVAYRQFCEHFLAPLAVSSVDPRLSGMWRSNLDGLPLDLACRLLPLRSRLRPGLLLHLFLHARSQARHAGRPATTASRRPALSRQAFTALLASLRGAIRSLKPRRAESAWADYGQTHNYTSEALRQKEETVRRWLGHLKPRLVFDLGGNLGRFGLMAPGAYVVCCDADPVVVEAAYRAGRTAQRVDLLPLVVDLANPSPGLGWEGRERGPFETRGPADAVLALALVHHLAIGRNVPLPAIAGWFARLGRSLVVEFVPKDDPQTARLLQSRRDVFPGYTREGFESAFGTRFRLEASEPIPGSNRRLYLCLACG
jgi:ribosomal protein L11 methylase PrmA